MEVLASVLPIVIDILLVVLLTVGIILLIKCIYLVDKARRVVDDVEEKISSLNAFFALIDMISDTVSLAGEKIVGAIEALIIKLFTKKKRKDEDDLDEEEELEEILSKERKRK